MGIFNSSKIAIDQADNYVGDLIRNPILSEYFNKWGDFVESNLNLWIKEKTELDMILSINFNSISVTLDYLLSSGDQRKLKKKISEYSKLCVEYACLIGVGYSVINKQRIKMIYELPPSTRQAFDLTYIPLFKLFEMIFVEHYKINSHLAFQKDGHLEDTKKGIIMRAITTCLEGSSAAEKLNFVIY